MLVIAAPGRGGVRHRPAWPAPYLYLDGDSRGAPRGCRLRRYQLWVCIDVGAHGSPHRSARGRGGAVLCGSCGRGAFRHALDGRRVGPELSLPAARGAQGACRDAESPEPGERDRRRLRGFAATSRSIRGPCRLATGDRLRGHRQATGPGTIRPGHHRRRPEPEPGRVVGDSRA